MTIAVQKAIHEYTDLREESRAIEKAYTDMGWTVRLVPRGQDVVKLARYNPAELYVDIDPAISAHSVMCHTESFPLERWGWGWKVVAETGEREAWETAAILQRNGINANVPPLPPRVCKDPGAARWFLKNERGYTNRRLKRMPISVMRRVARRKWPRTVQLTVTASLAVNLHDMQLFVHESPTAWLAWVFLRQKHGVLMTRFAASMVAADVYDIPRFRKGPDQNESPAEFDLRVRSEARRLFSSPWGNPAEKAKAHMYLEATDVPR